MNYHGFENGKDVTNILLVAIMLRAIVQEHNANQTLLLLVETMHCPNALSPKHWPPMVKVLQDSLFATQRLKIITKYQAWKGISQVFAEAPTLSHCFARLSFTFLASSRAWLIECPSCIYIQASPFLHNIQYKQCKTLLSYIRYKQITLYDRSYK